MKTRRCGEHTGSPFSRHNSQSLGEGWRAAGGLGAENGRKNEYDGITAPEMRNIARSDCESDDRRCWSGCGARGEQAGCVMGRVGRILGPAVLMLVPAVLMIAGRSSHAARYSALRKANPRPSIACSAEVLTRPAVLAK